MDKICLICAPISPPYAGPEVATDLLLCELRKSNFSFEFIKSNIKDSNKDKGKFNFKGLLVFLKILSKLILKLKNRKTDKLYLLLSSSKIGFVRDSVYIIAGIVFRKKIIAHYRGGNFKSFYDNSSPIFKKFIKKILKYVDTVIVQANILKFMFEDIFKGNIEVLYNGIPVDDNIINRKKREQINILFLGHISFAKGFYDLVEAYKMIYNEYENINLSFAGTIKFGKKSLFSQKLFLSGDNLKKYLNNYGVYEHEIEDFVNYSSLYRAKYLGIVDGDEKIKLFKKSDIFVLPSYTEGFSFSILEAMKYGLGIISTKVGALPEIIKNEENGFLIEPGNIDKLVLCLKKLIEDEELLNKISYKNQEYVKDNFNISKTSDNFKKIIEDIK
jgi:glycosyltransferase involved in cell wall biosynthesis